MSKEVKIYVREKDLWLLEALDKIVEGKRAMGLQSSFSFEFIRCARNGLVGSLEGSTLDEALLTEKEYDTD